MFNKTIFWLKKPSNTLWVLPAFGAILAIILNVIAKLATLYLEPNILPEIKVGIIDDLLDIITSSLLAVSIFSLSIMVSAFSTVSNNSSPRATELVMADDNTRLAIASFISAFIYAMIAKIALNINLYGQNGRFILFISIILVISYIIFMLINWIHTLSKLGRLENTLNKIYTATIKSLKAYRKMPKFGASWVKDENKNPNLVIKSNSTGYISHINLDDLQEIANKIEIRINALVKQGDYVVNKKDIIEIYFDNETCDINEDNVDDILNSFIIDNQRSYTQDPLFGFIVLSEVGQKALSPGINDQGTAINVLMLISKLILEENEQSNAKKEDLYDRVAIASLDESDFIYKSIDPIARDGANNICLSEFIQKVLYEISQNSSETSLKNAAQKQAKIVLERSLSALEYNGDKQKLQNLYNKYFS